MVLLTFLPFSIATLIVATSTKTSSPGTTSTLISFRSPDHTNSVIFTPLITSTADVGPGISQSESPTAITLVSSLEYIYSHFWPTFPVAVEMVGQEVSLYSSFTFYYLFILAPFVATLPDFIKTV